MLVIKNHFISYNHSLASHDTLLIYYTVLADPMLASPEFGEFEEPPMMVDETRIRGGSANRPLSSSYM